jgi:hypothetical protein
MGKASKAQDEAAAMKLIMPKGIYRQPSIRAESLTNLSDASMSCNAIVQRLTLSSEAAARE